MINCLVIKHRKLFFVCIIFFLFSAWGYSQSFAIKHLDVEDGLSGNDIYQMYQDSMGYMWFGTNSGLSRFDGVEFRNYNSAILQNDDVLTIKEMRGKIYFLTLDQQLYYLENDSIKIADPEIFVPPIQDFIEDKNNHSIWFYSNGDLHQFNYKDNIKKQHNYKSILYSFRLINKLNNGDIAIHSQNSFIIINSKTSGIKHYPYSRDLIKSKNTAFKVSSNNFIVSPKRTNSSFIFNGHQFEPFHIPGPKNERVASVEFINDEWWIITEENVYVLNKKKNSIISLTELLGKRIIREIYYDSNDNIWLGTKKNGVYLINNLDIRNYTLQNSKLPANQIQKMTIGQENSLWMGTENGWVSNFRDHQFINYKHKNFHNEYYDLEYKNERLFIVAQEIYQLYQNEIQAIYPSCSAKALCLDNGNIWLATSSSIERINVSQHKIESFIGGYRSYAIEALHENIWLGSIKGLFKIVRSPDLVYHQSSTGFDDHQMSLYLDHPSKGIFRFIDQQKNIPHGYGGYFESGQLIHQRYYDMNGDSIIADVKRIDFTSDSSVWMLTNNAGLYYIKNNIIHQFNDNDGLPINSCNDLFIDKDDNIWVGTTRGLVKIKYPSLDYTNYTTDDGILSNWITNVVRTADSTLYIGTNKGLSVIHQKHLKSNLNPIPIHFKKVEINGRDTSLLLHYKLPYYKNNIAIEFIGISFNSEVGYQYRLNHHKSWTSIQDPHIKLPELSPGKYNLEIIAKALNGAKSEMPISIIFHIGLPWWQTVWFKLLIFFSAIIFIYLWILSIKKKEQEKTIINKQFAELELQALQAQMNPHFVFNSMGAIQNFILNHNEVEANRYLTRFSKLMRLFLDSSREKYITLKDETTLLDLYLKMEKLRFREKLDYAININPELPLSSIEIPSMLVQPFVENAINHGLVFKESDGWVRVDFYLKDSQKICCTVTDNGIGRAEAGKRKNKSRRSYKSRATSIVEERLKALNFIEDTNISISINDRLNDNGNTEGTIVEIIMPLQQ